MFHIVITLNIVLILWVTLKHIWKQEFANP